jgi:hypothetical protein
VEAALARIPAARRSEPGVEQWIPRLTVLLALGHLEQSAVRPGLAPQARAEFLGALERAQTGDVDRFTCQTRLAHLDLLAGDLAGAESWISAARETAARAGFEVDDDGTLAALAAGLSHARGDERDVHLERRAEHGTELSALIGDWRSAAPRPGGLAPLRYSRNRFVVGTLVELCLATDPGEAGRLDALQVLYDVRSAGSLVRRIGWPVGDFAQARELLVPAEGGLLVYFVAKDRSHVFALERDRVTHATLPGEWALCGRARRSPQPRCGRRRTASRPGSGCVRRRSRYTRWAGRPRCAGSRRCTSRPCRFSSCSRSSCMGNPTRTCASRGTCPGRSARCRLPRACRCCPTGNWRRRPGSGSARTAWAGTS